MAHFINFVRIPLLAVRQHVKPLPRMGVLDADPIRMRVWPNDIDLNRHMNNGRYLSVMDFARTHLLARAGLLEHIIRSRWQPLVGAVWITYRRSLPLFAAFTISSRLVCWDERWFYLEQTFTGSEGLAAVGWVKGVLRDAWGVVEPQRVLEGVEPGIVSPPMPDTIAQWNELTREALRAADAR
ncbi:MAG TPA: thioesterase family protein [Terracidiphilus sp.]|nr:thioesterase family protein [Terracidiphilus sp.]